MLELMQEDNDMHGEIDLSGPEDEPSQKKNKKPKKALDDDKEEHKKGKKPKKTRDDSEASYDRADSDEAAQVVLVMNTGAQEGVRGEDGQMSPTATKKGVPRKDKTKDKKPEKDCDEAAETIQGAFKRREKKRRKGEEEESASPKKESSRRKENQKQKNGRKKGEGNDVEKPDTSPEEGKIPGRDQAARKIQDAFRNSIVGLPGGKGDKKQQLDKDDDDKS